MKNFCLPSDFKNETLDSYYRLNAQSSNSRVIETYGQMAPDTVFGSCRASSQLPEVDRSRLEEYIRYSTDRGLEFNYVVNATCMGNDELTSEGYGKVKNFFKMLQDIGVCWITLALPSLMEIAAYTAPMLKIKASTVCQVNSPHKAKFYEDLGVMRLVLDEDIYRKFRVLKNIRRAFSGDLEIIINSFCVNDCPYKMFHYNSFSHLILERKIYPYYMTRCRNTHIGGENFMKLNWIRPEDIHFYHETGINYFKLQGRTNVSSGDPVKAVKFYMDERYDGDLVKLLELFSYKKPLTIAETAVDNRKLDGFIERFAQDPDFCTKVCSECGYCKSYAQASISSTDMAVMDIMKMLSEASLGEFQHTLDDEQPSE